MPNYTLICRFEDGFEERSELSAEFGSGIDIGRKITRERVEWTIDEVIPGDPVTLIATQH